MSLNNCIKCSIILTPENRAKRRGNLCKKCHSNWQKEYRKNHLSYIREKERERFAKRYKQNKAKFAIKFHRETTEKKIKIITAYSKSTMACANPFEQHKEPYTTLEALTIDHINGGGRKHIKEIKNFYSWLIRNKYPEGFQVLCMNCQFIKRTRNKELY